MKAYLKLRSIPSDHWSLGNGNDWAKEDVVDAPGRATVLFNNSNQILYHNLTFTEMVDFIAWRNKHET